MPPLSSGQRATLWTHQVRGWHVAPGLAGAPIYAWRLSLRVRAQRPVYPQRDQVDQDDTPELRAFRVLVSDGDSRNFIAIYKVVAKGPFCQNGVQATHHLPCEVSLRLPGLPTRTALSWCAWPLHSAPCGSALPDGRRGVQGEPGPPSHAGSGRW